MSATLSLSQMVDLALGTPEVGACNFNVLHTLLHALLQKLDLGNMEADIKEHDRQFLVRRQSQTNLGSGTDGNLLSGKDDSSVLRGKPVYHGLVEKVTRMEQQMEILNGLPSNSDLLDQIKPPVDQGERSRPMANMWQHMQLTKRVGANEEGIGKLMSMFDDLMTEMNTLKDTTNNLQNQIEDLNKFKDMDERLKALEDLSIDDRLKALEELTNDLNDRLSQYPPVEQFEDYVTWTSLEDSLKGIRDQLNEKPAERIVIEMNTQTVTPEASRASSPPASAPTTPRAPSVHPSTRPSSGRSLSTPGPSADLAEILEKLGSLTNRHDLLEERVEIIEDQLKNKADKDDLIGLGGPAGIPDDLLDRFKELQNQLASIQKARDKLAGMEGMLNSITSLTEGQNHLNASLVVINNRVDTMSGDLQELESSVAQRVAEMPALTAPSFKQLDTSLSDGDLKRMKQNLADLEEKLHRLEELFMNMSAPMEITSSAEIVPISDGETTYQEPGSKSGKQEPVSKSEKQEAASKSGEPVDTPGPARVSLLADAKPVEPAKSGAQVDPTLVAQIYRNTSDLSAMKSKVKWLMEDTTHRFNGIKDRLSDVDDQLKSLASEVTNSNQQVVSLKAATDQQHKALKRLASRTEAAVAQATKNQATAGSAQRIQSTATPSTVTAPASLVRTSSQSSELDSDALSRMQQVVLQLQAEVERVSNTMQQLVDDSTAKQKDITNLFSLCADLEERKADKEFVHMEVDVKADKRHLEGKLNRSLFDSTCDELNKMISDILGKLTGHEDEWKKAMSQLSDDIDGKLDRLEFKPIRDELERQLKALSRKLNALDVFGGDLNGEDDAAGIRKQLIQRFHCISCDRPVDMMPHGPIPSIPATAGMPATRSTRPYTTFELDQIRQQARSGQSTFNSNSAHFEQAVAERQLARCRMHNCANTMLHPLHIPPVNLPFKLPAAITTQQQLDTDYYATARACGGSHTLTYPHRRINRVTHINNLFRDDDPVMAVAPPPMPPYKDEMDIQGADGHIYRGRVDENRLPFLGTGLSGQGTKMSGGGSPKPIRRAQTSHGPRPMPPQSMGPPRSPRPASARLSRPSSAQNDLQPGSTHKPFLAAEVPIAMDERNGSSVAVTSSDSHDAPPPRTTTPIHPSADGVKA